MYGERLRIARKNKNLTLINVGMRINASHTTISRYETGKLEPSLDTLKRLCEIYGVSADYVLGLPNGLSHLEKR